MSRARTRRGLAEQLELTPLRDARDVLAAVRAGGRAFETIVFTRNRRVMISVAAGGTLRLHHSFSAAPEEVLRAIGRLYGARRAKDRATARHLVRSFLGSLPARPSVPRPRRVQLADAPHLARLRAEFDRVNAEFFHGSLTRPPIHLSGRMRRRNGHFSSEPLEIVLSRRLCTHAAPTESERTLRHEMIHLWQHVQGRRPGHGADFRDWARLLDVHPRATRDVCWTAQPEHA